ncbi:hypothetical protein [Sansalvadorimonas verongulae]|uniref:hypothetical protein n=1 Tax=Sansalvadorimonas verongulae TaxID=2172824 RepID=UPI0012BCFD1D|nr:hypothetical protein [Sansalvadorimonas verongulae]MTI14345.1 hypothetical protein [Sansalvadorimonas verongulae]
MESSVSKSFLSFSLGITLSLGAALAVALSGDTHTTQNLGFQVTLEADGQSWPGQVVMTHEKWLNGSTLRLSSHFSETPPAGLGLPEYEDLQEDGGMVFTRIKQSPENKPVKGEVEELIRVTEYGTFAHMGEMVGHLASQPEERVQPLNSRQYLSQFLLLEEPASVKEVFAYSAGNGYQYDLAMSDGSQISYQLTQMKELQGIRVQRSNRVLTYRLK